MAYNQPIWYAISQYGIQPANMACNQPIWHTTSHYGIQPYRTTVKPFIVLDNVNENCVRKLEKFNESFVNNKQGIYFNNIHIYIFVYTGSKFSLIQVILNCRCNCNVIFLLEFTSNFLNIILL